MIAFQDTEAFPANLISDFILRNQTRLSRLPVVLLFGVASTLDQFQQMLPPNLIKLLDTKIFEVRQNDDCLKIIIDNVFTFFSILIAGVNGERTSITFRSKSVVTIH